jgi:hypothetical protein
MIRIFPNEEWKEFSIGDKTSHRHVISNYGRIIAFLDRIEDGRLLKGGRNHGYKTYSYYTTIGNVRRSRYIYLRRLVAEKFLQKTSPEQTYVLLLDNNRSNNFVGNLKWATRQEMLEHRKKSPYIIEAIVKLVEGSRRQAGHKLNSDKVKIIKRKIFDPKRKTRMKIIARQFGISEMQLYRIKSGENWGHVTID